MAVALFKKQRPRPGHCPTYRREKGDLTQLQLVPTCYNDVIEIRADVIRYTLHPFRPQQYRTLEEPGSLLYQIGRAEKKESRLKTTDKN